MAGQPELNKWKRYNVARGRLPFKGSLLLEKFCVVCLRESQENKLKQTKTNLVFYSEFLK